MLLKTIPFWTFSTITSFIFDRFTYTGFTSILLTITLSGESFDTSFITLAIGAKFSPLSIHWSTGVDSLGTFLIFRTRITSKLGLWSSARSCLGLGPSLGLGPGVGLGPGIIPGHVPVLGLDRTIGPPCLAQTLHHCYINYTA